VGRGAVLSVCTYGETIFAGCQDGFVTVRMVLLNDIPPQIFVKVWDLETKTLVRAILVQEVIYPVKSPVSH
jgi:hypothetical protein